MGLAVLGFQLRGSLPFSGPSDKSSRILGGTPAPTVFQPLESTADYFPTDYPTPTPTLTPTALRLTDKSRITQYFIKESMITDWITPPGPQVLLPNFQMVRKVLNKALNAP